MGSTEGGDGVSGVQGTAATRMNLLRSQRRLVRVEKGVDLLRRKREEAFQETD